MQKTSCKQIRYGLEEAQFRPTQKVRTFLVKKYTGCRSTLAVEECIGAAKNWRQVKQCKKFRRPETCAQLSNYGVAVASL